MSSTDDTDHELTDNSHNSIKTLQLHENAINWDETAMKDIGKLDNTISFEKKIKNAYMKLFAINTFWSSNHSISGTHARWAIYSIAIQIFTQTCTFK